MSEVLTDKETDQLLAGIAANNSAFRIFKILQWLQTSPCSVEMLNERFKKEPGIEKAVSQDSIWLYINTLKMLGCDISRPCPTNQFKYHLNHHPFGIFLSYEEIEMLTQVKSLAESYLSYQDILSFDQFLKHVFTQTPFADREKRIEELFLSSRSVDYEAQQAQIEQLQTWTHEHQLLILHYLSPIKGKKKFHFLPEELVYERGVLYLRGNQAKRKEPSLLRVDHICHAEPVNNDRIKHYLLRQQASKSFVKIQFFGITPSTYDPLNLGEEIRYTPAQAPDCVEIQLYTRDFFLLKQKLLASGYAFKVIEPSSFKQDMIETLKTMQRIYDHEV